MQKWQGRLEAARVTGQGKEQCARTAEQPRADHAHRQHVALPRAQQPLGHGAGEKAATAPGGDPRPAQAVAHGARLHGGEQGGGNVTLQVADEQLAVQPLAYALAGTGCEAGLDAVPIHRAVEDVDHLQPTPRQTRGHAQGVTSHPVRIDRPVVGQHDPLFHRPSLSGRDVERVQDAEYLEREPPETQEGFPGLWPETGPVLRRHRGPLS